MATSADQKILFSGRGVIMLCSLEITDAPGAGEGKTTANNGDTIIT
jgi:hypothetical protein